MSKCQNRLAGSKNVKIHPRVEKCQNFKIFKISKCQKCQKVKSRKMSIFTQIRVISDPPRPAPGQDRPNDPKYWSKPSPRFCRPQNPKTLPKGGGAKRVNFGSFWTPTQNHPQMAILANFDPKIDPPGGSISPRSMMIFDYFLPLFLLFTFFCHFRHFRHFCKNRFCPQK